MDLRTAREEVPQLHNLGPGTTDLPRVRRRSDQANYGPEYRGQGKLGAILEDGSINNPGHHNLDQSLDVVRPKFHRDISELIGNLFWPGNAS